MNLSHHHITRTSVNSVNRITFLRHMLLMRLLPQVITIIVTTINRFRVSILNSFRVTVTLRLRVMIRHFMTRVNPAIVRYSNRRCNHCGTGNSSSHSARTTRHSQHVLFNHRGPSFSLLLPSSNHAASNHADQVRRWDPVIVKQNFAYVSRHGLQGLAVHFIRLRMKNLFRVRRTNSGVNQRGLNLNVMLLRSVIMRLTYMNSLLFRQFRLVLRVRRVHVNLRLQVIFKCNLRVSGYTTRLIFHDSTLHRIATLHNLRRTNANLHSLHRRLKFINHVAFSHFRRIQGGVNALLRLRISLHPAILRAVA